MKKAGLIITVIICVLVFLVSLFTAIILTIKTVGWAELANNAQWPQKIEQFFSDFPSLNIMSFKRQTYEVDERQTADYSGIKTIKITAISENVQISAGDKQIEARLQGTYKSFSQKIVWRVEKQGDQLSIYADYPSVGLINSNLEMFIKIPSEFTGEVQVKTVSADCSFLEQINRQWSSFKFISTSGSLNLPEADMPELSFSSVSGKIDIRQCLAKVDGKTVSGDVSIGWENFKASSINTVSGKVNLILNQDSSCQITFTTVSGRFSNNGLAIQIIEQDKSRFTGKMNLGQQALKVHTVSGDLLMSSP